MKNIIVLIPSLNPPKEILTTYLEDLKRAGMEKIILVNDGSREDYNSYFENLKNKGIDIFKHHKNFGKGRALKNAFNYILENYPEAEYIITADSDGQHTVEDIKNIAKIIISEREKSLYLGVRDFNQSNVPAKSRYGNKITSFVYRLLFSDRLTDTQTGLRAIHKDFLYDFLDLKGERFEYEINMLINASLTKKKIKEIPIKTVYFDNNSETHFNPIKDSIKIYSVMFNTFIKFIFSAISSWILDIGLFSILFKIFDKLSYRIFIATFFARLISGIYNFNINKSFVFEDDSNSKDKLLKYGILWAVQLLISAFLVNFIYDKLSFNASLIKIIVDTVLFIISYRIQRNHIFNKGGKL